MANRVAANMANRVAANTSNLTPLPGGSVFPIYVGIACIIGIIILLVSLFRSKERFSTRNNIERFQAQQLNIMNARCGGLYK